MESHLLQMRGLKLKQKISESHRKMVASFTDAWIETKIAKNNIWDMIVASFTDAWIETIRLS